MGDMLLPLGSAVWLGILTSISPCPLATNIAAISFIGRRVGNPKAVAATGLLYTLGRSLAYVVLAAILVGSLLSAPGVSHVLQKYMNKILGPVLILVGMLLLELIQIKIPGGGMGEKMGKRVEGWGIWGGFALGVVFAMSFCPASAGLYFGSLIPLSVKYESSILLPLLFGIGTALPVFAFAILIALGTQAVGRAFEKITQFEWWARRITGAVFLIVGVYFCLAFVFRVL
jgi:cytochrome c biogenesis protein CcdA